MESYKDRRWFKKEEGDENYSSCVFSEYDRIRDRDNPRIEQILDACGIYGDASAFYGFYGVLNYSLNNELVHNLVAPAIDTLAAEITQSTIRPMVITTGGDRNHRANARKMTRYLDAVWDRCDIDAVTYQVVMDALITGMGIGRVFRANPADPSSDSISIERVFPGNAVMDDRYCIDTMPREFYIVRHINKSYLADIFPDFEEQIWAVPDSERIHYPAEPTEDNFVEVVEAHHLASSKKSNDGRRVLSIRNCVLSYEEHSRTENPPGLVFLRGLPARMGYWGESVAMRAAPTQLELNKMTYRMQVGHHFFTTPKVFLNRQSGIVDTHLTNDIGDIIEYDGEPPRFYTPQAFSSEFYKYVERLEEKVFRVLGVSELSAVSRKPPGLESGAALRTFSDFQTRRWKHFVGRYERFCEDLARECIMCEKAIAEDNPGHSINISRKDKSYEVVKWRDVDIDEERFVTRIYSASALPNTPAGKLQALEEMVKTGVIDQSTFIRLADVPDFESVRDLLVAGDELMESMFDRMLEEDDFYASPEPGLDLKKGRVIAAQMAWREQMQPYDNEQNIQKLYQWISESMATEKFMAEQEMADQIAQQQLMQPPAPINGPPPGPQQGPIPQGGQAGMSMLGTQPAPPAPFREIPTA